MDQKDSSTHMKKLASASELRGKKSGMTGGKKGGKKMWISLVSMVVVLGLAVGAFYLSGVIKPEDATPEATPLPSNTVKVIDYPRAEVASVKVAAKGQEPYTVLSEAKTTGEGDDARTEYLYTIDGQPEFKLNQTTAGSIIGYAANLTATQQVAENVTDFAPYGLDDPALTVTMNYRDGTSHTWLFGNQIPTSTSYYFCEQGSRTVFSAYASAYTTLASSLNSLYTVAMPVTISDASLIRDILIEQKGKETIEMKYLEEGETSISITTLRLVQPILYDANSERASEVLTAAQALTIESYAGELSQLPEAGLEDPRAHVRFSDAEGNTVDFRIGNYCGTDKVYVQVDDTDAVYLTSASSLAFLDNANVGYLVDQFANLVNIQKVDAISIQAGNTSYDVTITREPVLDANGNPEVGTNGKNKTNDTYTFNGEVTEEDLFKKLYQIIIGTMNSKISDDRAIEGKVVASVHYTLNEAPGEFTVEYLEYDEDYYAVRRDNLTLFLIKHDRIDQLLEKLAQYADGTFVAE